MKHEIGCDSGEVRAICVVERKPADRKIGAVGPEMGGHRMRDSR